MSANRANIAWHLRNMIGGDDIPKLGTKGYHPGALAIKTTGRIGLGAYYNYGTFDSCDFKSPGGMSAILVGGSEQNIQEVSTTQNYDAGARLVDPFTDRVFRYCLSSGQCDPYIGNVFMASIGTGAGDLGIDWSALAEDAAIGAESVVMTNQGGHTIAKDALRGGLITLNPSSGTNNDTIQHRHITGNTAATASGTCTISFANQPLIRALTGSTAYAFAMASPYRKVQGAQVGTSPGRVSFVGYAAAEVSGTGIWHWEQTAGPISASLYGAAVGKTQYMREVVFRYDGNLIHRGASGATGLEAQQAGYIMDNNGADNGATMIMLQLDRCG